MGAKDSKPEPALTGNAAPFNRSTSQNSSYRSLGRRRNRYTVGQVPNLRVKLKLPPQEGLPKRFGFFFAQRDICTRDGHQLADLAGNSPGSSSSIGDKKPFQKLIRTMSFREKNFDDRETPVWYHEWIRKSNVEQLLKQGPDGKFLVKNSTEFPGDLCLCVSYAGQVYYYRVRRKGSKYTLDYQQHFSTVVDLVEYYKRVAVGGQENDLDNCDGGIPVKLTAPCVRLPSSKVNNNNNNNNNDDNCSESTRNSSPVITKGIKYKSFRREPKDKVLPAGQLQDINKNGGHMEQKRAKQWRKRRESVNLEDMLIYNRDS